MSISKRSIPVSLTPSTEQDVFLFTDTIANNISFGKPNATLEEIKDAHVEAVKAPQKPQPQPSLPSLVEMAKNYANAMSRKYVAKMSGEDTTVSQEVFDERL